MLLNCLSYFSIFSTFKPTPYSFKMSLKIIIFIKHEAQWDEDNTDQIDMGGKNCSYLYNFLSLCSIPVRNPKSHPLLRIEERVNDTDDPSIHTVITNYSIYVQPVSNLRTYHISLTVPTVNTICNLQRTRSHRSPVMHVAKPTTNSQMDKLRYGEFASLVLRQWHWQRQVQKPAMLNVIIW